MSDAALHARSAELFHSACQLPEAEREAWVRASCDGDDALVQATLKLLGADLAGGHVAFLSTQSAFSRLSPRILTVIADRMRPRYFEADEDLVRQGEHGDSLLVVQSGDAEVRLAADGKTHVLARLGRGDVLGEMALVTGAPRNATVVALSPLKALELSSNDFYEAMVRYSEVAELLTNIVAERLGRSLLDLDGLGGKVLEGYRITRPVGRGAMAVVYEASPLTGGDRVALKMMSHRLSLSDTAMLRFEHEADMVASLRHPTVARCLGRFDAYGTCFMVMEFLDGPELGELVRRAHPLPEGEVRKILGALAQSLAHVHAAGIVHGDLKPANVMLTRTGLVKLTDFGIATALSAIEPRSSGLLGGTPLYMAPELFDRGRMSPAADVYSLGCVLWELLVGARLFQEKELETLVWKKQAFVLPPRESVRPDLAPDLYAVLAQSLQRDPRRRTLDLEGLGKHAGRVDAALLQRALERSGSSSS